MDHPDAPERETTTGSRVAFHGKLITVRVDDVRLPSGKASVREVVEHPGSVAVLPVTADGEILLVRQRRHAIDGALTEIPAGLIDPGEEPRQTAARELLEETGHRPGELRRITEVYPSAGFSTERLTIFLATGCRPEADHQPDQDEGISLLRVPVDDLPALVAPGSEALHDAKTAIALLWLAAHPGDAG